jgi:hypothetical protein
MNNFGYYLAGLIEGAGYIYVPKERGGKKYNSRIEITFHLYDFPLALEIIKRFPKGVICKIKGKKAYLLILDNKENLLQIIELINGKFRTPKINKLHQLIRYLNSKHNLAIPFLPLDDSPLDSNPWLSGFVEANGNFYVRITESNLRIDCTFSISQREIDISKESCLPFIKKLKDFFEGYLKKDLPRKNRKTYNPIWVIKVSGNSKIIKVIQYFSKFPLFGVKYLNYKDFEKIFEMQFNKKELLTKMMTKSEFFLECKKIKSEMNDSRSTFSFNHLNTLYK